MTKTVLITGASRGIGKAIALKLLKEGHSLSLGVRKKEDLINTLNQIQHKTLIPHLLARERKSGGWGVNSHTYGISKTDTTQDLEMGEWIGAFLHGLIKFGHGEEATQKALEESNK